MEWFKENKKETEHVRETVKGLNDRSFQIPAKGVVMKVYLENFKISINLSDTITVRRFLLRLQII